MQIVLDQQQPQTRAVPRPAAIWPLAAITAAALIALVAGTSASMDDSDSGDAPRVVVLTVNEAV